MEDLLPTWMEKIYFLFCRKMNMVVIYIGISPLIYNPIKKAGKIGELLLIPAFVRATGN